jgi:hypothetical protein
LKSKKNREELGKEKKQLEVQKESGIEKEEANSGPRGIEWN